MNRVAVIDSSCVRSMMAADLLSKLSMLFNAIYLPIAVRRELRRKRAVKEHLQRVRRQFDFIQDCNRYDASLVALHLLPDRTRSTKDRGEAEMVVQAQTFDSPVVLVDDKWGRELALALSLRCHGSIWVIRQLKDQDLITASEARQACKNMASAGRWLPKAEVKAFLLQIGEEPLA